MSARSGLNVVANRCLNYFSFGTSARRAFGRQLLHGQRSRVEKRDVRNRAETDSNAVVQLPLVEREAVHETDLHNLLLWYDNVVRKVDEMGDAMDRDDGGPSKGDLRTELKWLMEDMVSAVADEAADGQELPAWKPASFSQLRMLWLSGAGERGSRGSRVRTRLSEAGLDNLWQERLQVVVHERNISINRQHRVQDRVPIQYLTNGAHWRDLLLAVGPGVLIPRPETEQMIDLAAAAVRAAPQLAAAPWLDLGTGSGALALGLASRAVGAMEVLAVEAHDSAAAWAAFNFARHPALASRIRLLRGSWFEAVPVQLQGHVAGIVSNPPYIPTAEMPAVQPEVRLHEPWTALNGGPGTGMHCHRHIVVGAAAFLRPGGYLLLETAGGTQADLVADLLRSLPSPKTSSLPALGAAADAAAASPAFQDIAVLDDYFGKRRFVSAFRSPSY